MQETIDFARKYWNIIGVESQDQDVIEFMITDIIRAITNRYNFSNPEKIKNDILEYSNELRNIEKKYKIDDYKKELPGQKKIITLEEGIKYVGDLICESKAIGLVGMPASGKTTFMNMLKDSYSIDVIDEFWDEQPRYDDKLREFDEIRNQNNPVIVAASQISHPDIETLIFLETDDATRKYNLEQRKCQDIKISDNLRCKFYEAFRTIDRLLFGLQKIDADAVIDSRVIRY
jgi:ABC-type glutathione transport system ATPase component